MSILRVVILNSPQQHITKSQSPAIALGFFILSYGYSSLFGLVD